MNVDDAFESLAKRRKLTIPRVAVPPPAVDFPVDDVSTEVLLESDSIPAPAPVSAKRTPSVVVPASALLDSDEADYMPHGSAAADSVARVAPTETDLLPVMDDAPTPAAPPPAVPVAAPKAAEAPKPVPERADAWAERAGAVLNLARARRYPRFGYLPFAPDGRLAESCRRLRAQILALAPERPSVLVTSAERGEGRTELAIRLALSLAKRPEASILLADFDLRNPTVAPRLGLPLRQFALADALRGACPVEEAISYGEEDNLYVLAARPADREGDDLLDARQARRLLARLHATFDFVVMDCGPAGADAAPILLGRQAGCVVLAARSGVARPAAVRRAAETLIAAGADVGGVVLTAAG